MADSAASQRPSSAPATAQQLGPSRRREPRRLRLRLFTVVGRLVRSSRRLRLRLAALWLWAQEITAAITRPQNLASG